MADVAISTLIVSALRKIGAVDPRNSPDTTEYLASFAEMKRMFAADAIPASVSVLDQHTLTAGTKSYTIGSGATINTAKPIVILPSSFVNAAGQDIPLNIVDEVRYNQIAFKDLGTDWPVWLWYKPGATAGTIYLFPPGGGTLNLWSKKHFTDQTNYTSNLGLDEIYQDYVVWNLAERLWPEYNSGDPSGLIMRLSAASKKNIRNFLEVNDYPEAETDSMFQAHVYNIDAG